MEKIFNNWNLLNEQIIKKDIQIMIIYIITKSIINNSNTENNEINEFYSALKRELQEFKLDEISLAKTIETYNNNMDSNKKISFEYSLNNFMNIIIFLENNIINKDFIGDVVEFLFIIAFLFFFKLEKEHCINFYFYRNCSKLSSIENLEKIAMNKNLIKNNKELLNYFENPSDENKHEKNINPLNISYFEKLKFDFDNNFINNFQYEPDSSFINELYNIKSISKAIIPLIYISQYIIFKKIKYSLNTLLNTNKNELKNIKEYYYKLLQSVYNEPRISYEIFFKLALLVYQIKHSEYMQLENIPFNYNFNTAYNNIKCNQFIINGIKYDKRINIITFSTNILGDIGMFELGKNLCFNQNIKEIDFSNMNINSVNLNFLIKGIFLNELRNIKEFNISNNNLEKGGIYIAKILHIFINLEVLNLNNCNLKSGMKPILLQIKKLYSNKNYLLNKLYILSNDICQGSIYTLGDIIKLKNCQLKILSCGYSNFKNKAGKYFLNCILKNNNLEELYMYKSGFDDKDYSYFRNLLIISKVNVLSIYHNNFKNFETFLKLISLTKKISIKIDNKKDDIFKINNNLLYKFDISDNPIHNELILKDDITLLKDICNNSGLYILNMSHIIYGKNNGIRNNIYNSNKFQKEEYELLSIIKGRKDNFKILC